MSTAKATEAGVGHTPKTPLQGMRFETIDEAQTCLDRWDTRWADTRIHGTTKRRVAAMSADEQPAPGALPLDRFAMTTSASARASRWLCRSRHGVLQRPF
jgi:hypothetical protein